jgi:hypothetical protein
MEEMRNAYKILIVKCEGNKSLATPKRTPTLEDNTEINFTQIE